MTDGEFTQAELFDVFSNARRRRTVQYLKQRNGSCDLSSLVEQVAAWENDTDPETVTRTQRRRVYISLYQTHLPMLEDHGIVDWNSEDHAIELVPGEETFEPYIGRRLEDQRQWERVYALVTAVGVGTLALTWLSVGPMTATMAPLVALVLCVLVLFVALAHHVSRRPNLPIPFSASSR